MDKGWEELVKCKDYSLYKRLEDDFLFAPNLAERVSDQFKTTKEFILLLNKAIDFSIEEL